MARRARRASLRRVRAAAPALCSARSRPCCSSRLLIVARDRPAAARRVWVRFMLPCVASVAGYGLYLRGRIDPSRELAAARQRAIRAATCATSDRHSRSRGSSISPSRPIGAVRSMPPRWSCCTSWAWISSGAADCRRPRRVQLHRDARSQLSRSDAPAARA